MNPSHRIFDLAEKFRAAAEAQELLLKKMYPVGSSIEFRATNWQRRSSSGTVVEHRADVSGGAVRVVYSRANDSRRLPVYRHIPIAYIITAPKE